MGVYLFNKKGLTMPTSKKRNFARKIEKSYPFVTFKSELFEDDFTFPKLESAPLRVIEAMNTGEVQHVSAWLLSAGTDKEAVEAYRDLSQEELMEFIEDWTNGQPVGLGKSAS